MSKVRELDLSFDRGTLVLRGLHHYPGFEFDSRIGALRGHAIDYAATRANLLKEFGRQFTDQVRVPARVSWPKIESVTLRTEQQMAVDAWLAAEGRGCIIMPTGRGRRRLRWPSWRRCA